MDAEFRHDQQHLEADTSDTDSALGDDISAYTQSLRSSLLESVRENGRGYHRYLTSSGKDYVMPEDEEEQDRLDLQHHIFEKTFHGKLLLAPVVQDQVHEVLDLGTGTGAWAIDYADENPESMVTGTDLSPIQPSLVPPNCKFVVDDFEKPWLFKQKFDVVHGRVLASSVSSFPALFQRAFDALHPGGWIEMQDICLPLGSDDGTLSPDCAHARWVEYFMESLEKGLGRSWAWAANYKQWLEEAGFEDVQQFIFKWPINTWPKDPRMKEIGGLNLVNCSSGLEGL